MISDIPPTSVVLPRHLPAQCFVQSAADYQVPQMVLVALVKVESDGRGRVGQNSNGTQDIGVAQHNSATWVPYLKAHFGIQPDALAKNPCQSIRAAAYVLRVEMNHKSCAGVDVWCGLRRYHAPNNRVAGDSYVLKIDAAIKSIILKGSFSGD